MAAQSCREHQDMIVALKASLYHCRKVAALIARLVYRDAYWGQTRKVHQQIIDQISELSIEMATYHRPQCHAVGTSKRMV